MLAPQGALLAAALERPERGGGCQMSCGAQKDSCCRRKMKAAPVVPVTIVPDRCACECNLGVLFPADSPGVAERPSQFRTEPPVVAQGPAQISGDGRANRSPFDPARFQRPPPQA
jgi:hypothetical protein